MRTERADKHLAKIRARETPYTVIFAGIEITIFENVYPTTELSELVVECLDHPTIGVTASTRVLDYGTGTGFLAVHAALRGAKVVALDINPDAIACAKFNAERHRVAERIDFRLSDSLQAIGHDEQFDVILAGIPFDDAETYDILERSMYDPDFTMRRALLERSHTMLTPEGYILRTYSEQAQQRHPIEAYDNAYAYSIASQRLIKDEPHFVYLIQPKPNF